MKTGMLALIALTLLVGCKEREAQEHASTTPTGTLAAPATVIASASIDAPPPLLPSTPELDGSPAAATLGVDPTPLVFARLDACQANDPDAFLPIYARADREWFQRFPEDLEQEFRHVCGDRSIYATPIDFRVMLRGKVLRAAATGSTGQASHLPSYRLCIDDVGEEDVCDGSDFKIVLENGNAAFTFD